jgi:hypothetical protein
MMQTVIMEATFYTLLLVLRCIRSGWDEKGWLRDAPLLIGIGFSMAGVSLRLVPNLEALQKTRLPL